MEGGKLQPGFEKEAVPGFLSGVEADPLIGGIGAGEAQDRIRIPALGQTGQKPRRVDPIPELPRVIPAEEPVLGVLPGQVEEELALPGGGRGGRTARRPPPPTGGGNGTACEVRTAGSWRGTLLVFSAKKQGVSPLIPVRWCRKTG